MIKEIFSIEAEIQKILCVFRGIENEWENNANLSVEFRYYKDVTPRRGNIDGFMNDLLFGNHFREFPHFAATIKSDLILFWLIITEDDKNSSLKTSFQVYFNDPEAHLVEEVDLCNVRGLLWKIFDFFDDGCHLKPDAEEIFKNLVTK